MEILIFIIVILVGILPKLLSKDPKKNTSGGRSQPERPLAGSTAHKSAQTNKASQKARPNKPRKSQPDKTYSSAKPQTKKKSAAKKSAEVFCDADRIMEAALENTRQVERENDLDAEEDFMAGVYDAMVKGPKDTISFQRDFIAEGIDMLNNLEVVHAQEQA